MLINYILAVIILILFVKVLFGFYYLYISSREIRSMGNTNEYKGDRQNVLIVIPVLREQNVIVNTMEHFRSLKVNNMNLMVCIAGTIREKLENDKFENTKLTSDIVYEWIKSYDADPIQDLKYFYAEATDKTGDRASQLNYSVNLITKIYAPDIIGVYDADSLPDRNTLIEVMNLYSSNKMIICQQPVHFIKAANRMAIQKKNPILIANALYQTNWTMIRELPRWSKHHEYCTKKTMGIYKRNDYLIGHGEFLPCKIYNEYQFPENEVTDGIQLGYRLSMSGQDIAPLHTFCDDDVPQRIMQLIFQHKRWFGGCMRLYSSFRWSEINKGKKAVLQLMDGYWSQFSWAYASIVSMIGICLSIISLYQGHYILPICDLMLIFVYCYVIPFISHQLLQVKIKVRIIDWLCLPIAIALKGIGPNLFFIEAIITKITHKKIKYTKVER